MHPLGCFFRINNMMDETVLLNKIMLRIEFEKKALLLKRKIAVFSVILVASFGALIPAIKGAYSGFAMSGISSLFSLLFSDTSIVLQSWENFSLSLLEVLPINGILMAVALLVVCSASAKFLFKNLKGFQNTKQLINI